jgi:peptidoglycan hydrolase-like protein with peptidoglycan-binding domain
VFKVILSALVLTALMGALPGAVPGATQTKPHKKRHTTPAASATHAKKTTTAAASKRKGKKARTPARSYQQAPTADRYREIQQALASKGYFHGEPTGEWGADSIDALKRFQTDQNLMPDGKIGSLSLIALGLGPKRMTAKTDAAVPVPAASGPATSPAGSSLPPPPQ